MAPTARPDRRLTYDDFLLFPDGDGLRHEIIDGVHYVTAAPSLRHQDLVGRLYLAIGNFLAATQASDESSCRLSTSCSPSTTSSSPTSLFVAGDQIEIMTEKNIQGAPAIVVEVVSKSTRQSRRTNQEGTLRSRRRAGVLGSSIPTAANSSSIVAKAPGSTCAHRCRRR